MPATACARERGVVRIPSVLQATHRFRGGARDERRAVHLKIEGPKLSPAGDVAEGLLGRSPLHVAALARDRKRSVGRSDWRQHATRSAQPRRTLGACRAGRASTSRPGRPARARSDRSARCARAGAPPPCTPRGCRHAPGPRPPREAPWTAWTPAPAPARRPCSGGVRPPRRSQRLRARARGLRRPPWLQRSQSPRSSSRTPFLDASPQTIHSAFQPRPASARSTAVAAASSCAPPPAARPLPRMTSTP